MLGTKSCLMLVVGVFFAHSMQSFRPKLLGKKAPLFVSKAVFPDGEIQSFDLKDYIGKSDIVLYFYCFNNTSECTRQAESFKQSNEALKKMGIMVIGVSCDFPMSHKRFQKKLNLPYPLVSDSRIKREISSKYGALGFFQSKRRTFLINKKGIIVKVFDEVNIDTQIDDILKSFAIAA